MTVSFLWFEKFNNFGINFYIGDHEIVINKSNNSSIYFCSF